MAFKHSSSLIRSLTKNMFEKKHILFGRILDHWSDIAGKDLAEKAQPVSISYRKTKEKETVFILKVIVPSAFAMQLSYHRPVLAEKINQLIGKPRCIDILLDHQSHAPLRVKDFAGKQAPFSYTKTTDENIAAMVDGIEDTALKEKLLSYLHSANR